MPPRRRRKPKETALESPSPNNASHGERRWKLWLAVVVVSTVAGGVLLKVLFSPPPYLHPFKASLLKNCPIFTEAYARERLWGTYRPGLYFGLRMRLPSSLLAGLMWTDAAHVDGLYRLRHLAKQDDDLRYGWTAHNGRDFGVQSIDDRGNDCRITTSWAKQDLDWSVRIAVESPEPKEVAFFFYLADEAPSTATASLEWKLLEEGIGQEGLELLTGIHGVTGRWHLSLHSADLSRLTVYRSGFPVQSTHDLMETLQRTLYDSVRLQYLQQGQRDVEALQLRLHDPPLWLESAEEKPNFAVFQIKGRTPFSFDTVFLDGPFRLGRYEALTGAKLGTLLRSRAQHFDEAFRQTWLQTAAPHDATVASALKSALSNLLGGIGYFYGASRVRPPGGSATESFPTALLTAVPSRSFFPRGFLWDEGFHLLLVQKWDPLLAMDILAHWLDLLSRDGWIPREQILGAEARSRVPSEFVVQNSAIGNPPTLFFALQSLAAARDPISRAFLSAAWPRLVGWFDWMLKNHRGPIPGTYRWTSRKETNTKLNALTLDSGLDDYPRASHPTEAEYHLDIRCWMAMAARAMAEIATVLGKPEAQRRLYAQLAVELGSIESLRERHYDAESGWFSDFGLHAEGARLKKYVVPGPNGAEERMFRVVEATPKLQWISQFGYVSLFPFFMELIDPGEALLERYLELIQDPELLWTPYGLRSLAKTSPFYQRPNTPNDPPYWRGAIWINMNFLALEALEYYARAAGPYAEAAAQIRATLRQNVLQNVVAEFRRTGFFWEQYDDVTGHGKGCRPFTGWTALVLFMV